MPMMTWLYVCVVRQLLGGVAGGPRGGGGATAGVLHCQQGATGPGGTEGGALPQDDPV